MANRKPIKVKEEAQVREPRIPFRQFIASQFDMSPEQKAGFKAFLGSKNLMRQSQWEEKLKEYNNR